ADSSGLRYWRDALESGNKTAANVVEGFMESKEMKSKKLSNEEYVRICYEALMNRNPSQSEVAYWTKYYDIGMTNRYVLDNFINSTEFGKICAQFHVEQGSLGVNEGRDINAGITGFVSRCYTKALKRNYDITGLNHWCLEIYGSQDKREAAIEVATKGFFHSNEFLSKELSHEEYIERLYQTFLNRSSDKAGLTYWLNELNKGKDRDASLNGFGKSNEFNAIMAYYGL
ncbi:MAG: DUF4214 domain-containing protein, partial [Solobacterium sp.]|nr:DUF4214 domain-containing protein [Solobacterium sp.]